nr:MAG TPA: hypothetical protein [Caudoviricetes sp.]
MRILRIDDIFRHAGCAHKFDCFVDISLHNFAFERVAVEITHFI